MLRVHLWELRLVIRRVEQAVQAHVAGVNALLTVSLRDRLRERAQCMLAARKLRRVGAAAEGGGGRAENDGALFLHLLGRPLGEKAGIVLPALAHFLSDSE